jgi:hypothetical protein
LVGGRFFGENFCGGPPKNTPKKARVKKEGCHKRLYEGGKKFEYKI